MNMRKTPTVANTKNSSEIVPKIRFTSKIRELVSDAVLTPNARAIGFSPLDVVCATNMSTSVMKKTSAIPLQPAHPKINFFGFGGFRTGFCLGLKGALLGIDPCGAGGGVCAGGGVWAGGICIGVCEDPDCG